jgi:hypothetical protein
MHYNVTNANNCLARVARRAFKVVTVGLVLLSTGCSSLPVPLFGSKEQVLRKQVEADSFPTAKQAGL